MKIGELERLAAAGESETLELKRSTGERRMGVRAVCAMLNHHGGRVLFGVDPDGRVLGQTVNDRTIERRMLRVARFRGTDRTEFLDNRQFHGNTFDLLGRAERCFRENLPIAGNIEPGVFERGRSALSPGRTARGSCECHLPPGLLDRWRLGGRGDL